MMTMVALFFLFVCFYMCVCVYVCMYVAFMMKIPSNVKYYSSSLHPILTAEGTVDRGGIAGIREHRRID